MRISQSKAQVSISRPVVTFVGTPHLDYAPAFSQCSWALLRDYGIRTDAHEVRQRLGDQHREYRSNGAAEVSSQLAMLKKENMLKSNLITGKSVPWPTL